MRGTTKTYEVARFVEKPNRRLARTYLANKDYLWNAGIFTWSAGVFLDAIKAHAPELYLALDLAKLDASYRRMPNRSIDYALLEKAANRVVLKTAMDWCDIGSWDMFLERSRTDHDGNVVQGRSRQTGARGSLILNYREVPVVVEGVKNVLVVNSERGLLICRRGFSEQAARYAKDAHSRD